MVQQQQCVSNFCHRLVRRLKLSLAQLLVDAICVSTAAASHVSWGCDASKLQDLIFMLMFSYGNHVRAPSLHKCCTTLPAFVSASVSV